MSGKPHREQLRRPMIGTATRNSRRRRLRRMPRYSPKPGDSSGVVRPPEPQGRVNVLSWSVATFRFVDDSDQEAVGTRVGRLIRVLLPAVVVGRGQRPGSAATRHSKPASAAGVLAGRIGAVFDFLVARTRAPEQQGSAAKRRGRSQTQLMALDYSSRRRPARPCG